MNGLAIRLAILLLVLFIIGFGLAYFERMLARMKSHIPGLIMPVAFLAMSVFAIISTLPTMFGQAEQMGGIGYVFLAILISFVLTNLPTAVVYVTFYCTRKKMGEQPFPFKKKTSESESDTDSSESKE